MSCSNCRKLAEAEAELAGLKTIFAVFYRVLTPDQVAQVRAELSRIDQGHEEMTG